jgi:hypothetical protein
MFKLVFGGRGSGTVVASDDVPGQGADRGERGIYLRVRVINAGLEPSRFTLVKRSKR